MKKIPLMLMMLLSACRDSSDSAPKIGAEIPSATPMSTNDQCFLVKQLTKWAGSGDPNSITNVQYNLKPFYVKLSYSKLADSTVSNEGDVSYAVLKKAKLSSSVNGPITARSNDNQTIEFEVEHNGVDTCMFLDMKTHNKVFYNSSFTNSNQKSMCNGKEVFLIGPDESINIIIPLAGGKIVNAYGQAVNNSYCAKNGK